MIKTFTLPCGIKLVCENLSHSKSLCIGVWIKSGSAYENIKYHGMSHFIEHMLFKGTETKSAKDIAVIMDSIGGQLNAFTARDCTCFYTKTLSSDMETALGLLADMLINPKISEADIETEKNVVKEEISMYEDTPDELVLDLLYDVCYKDHPLGRTILGTENSVSSFTRNDILDYMQTAYCAKNTVISVVGSFNEEKLLEKTEQYFGGINKTNPAENPFPVPVFTQGNISRTKPIEQSHIAIAYPSYRFTDENVYAMSLASNILGGSMSSRLFQNIREKEGLCYSVYSYPTCYSDAGNVTLYAGCAKENTETVLNMMQEEVENLRNFSHEEFIRSKNQLKGSYILSNESISGKMSVYGKQLLLYGKITDDTALLSKIDKITEADVKEALKFLDNSFCTISSVIPE